MADAITAANTDSSVGGCSAGSGADMIDLTEDVLLTSVLPAVTAEATLDGNGHTVARDGSAPEFRILELDTPETLEIANVTLTNGSAIDGGGILVSAGELFLDNVQIVGNRALNDGGGIWNANIPGGTVVMVNSTMDSNQADSSGGGIYSRFSETTISGSTISNNRAGINGGGLSNGQYSNVTIVNSTVSGNVAANGGGLLGNISNVSLTDVRVVGNRASNNGGGFWTGYSYNGVDIVRTTFDGNEAVGNGGAIYADFGSEVSISASTISNNQAAMDGGGLFSSAYSYNFIVNSTISGNSASGDGGGSFNESYGGTLSLTSTTIVGNSATIGGGVYAVPIFFNYTDLNRESTLIASNAGGNCAGSFEEFDLGGNFDDDGSCLGALPVAAGVDFDASLANNGGPTQTHAILSGSAVIDGGGACGLTEDQRGFPRDAICDAGAVEFGAAPVGGSLTDIRGVKAICRNLTSGQSVTIPLTAADNTWDCEGAGLPANIGDEITQVVQGEVLDGAGGSMIGLVADRVSCRNNTSGQTVNVILTAGNSWNCVDAGMTVEAGDRIRMVAMGVVP